MFLKKCCEVMEKLWEWYGDYGQYICLLLLIVYLILGGVALVLIFSKIANI